MQLRRIDIRDFRKIGRREIADLADGLNILVGDNEAGKSTVLAALRAAFFERHRVGGTVAEGMLPYGSQVRPTITVEFEIEGRPWSLTKAFCQRPEASLQGPGERHNGDAVEDRLAELFGFTPPGRGASNPREHHGTHGLLWVEQGLRPNLGIGAGRDTIAGALEREIGQVTGGERGRALLAAAAERRERFWDKRDRPRGLVVEARRHLEELEAEQATLLGRHRDDEARLARLEAVTTRLERHRRDDHLGRAIAEVGAASRAVGETTRRASARDAALAARREAERQVEDARERRERRQALVTQREQARAEAEKAAVAAEEAGLLARQRSSAVQAADRASGVARQALEAVEQQLQAAEVALRRKEGDTALAEQKAKLAAAEDQAARCQDAASRADAIAIDAERVAALTALERIADRARAELEAASVQIAFEPEGARRIGVDGRDHPSAQPLGLARDATLVLEGFGRLHLRPGGGTAVLARKLDAAERSFRDALAATGTESLSDARRLLQTKSEARAEAASLAKALAVIAPHGVDALRQAVSATQARLALLPTAPQAAAEAQDVAQVQRSRVDCRAAAQTAEAAAKAAAAANQVAATEAARLTERRDAARRRTEELGDAVIAARGDVDDDRLAARLLTAERTLAEAQDIEAAAAAAHAAGDGEAAQLALERAERAEREIRRDFEGLEREQRDLRVELRAVGHDGVSERLAALDGECDVARAAVAGLEREAAASRLLHETLLAAQRESKERWLGPVRACVAPYLRLIHPDSDIRIDDRTLEIEGLYRGGVLEQFGALSMGAREQVAVVTRLALAEILRAAGHPAAVILDDALVNTDDARLDRMRNVLTLAARKLQILIFTCRERDFLGLGSTHRI